MRHRADIERDGASTPTGWNSDPVPSFAAHLANVKCFAWSTGRREVVDSDKTAVIEDLRCIMPLETDVTERDRVASITDRRGTTLYAGPLRIEAVQRVHTHLELTLDRIDT